MATEKRHSPFEMLPRIFPAAKLGASGAQYSGGKLMARKIWCVAVTSLPLFLLNPSAVQAAPMYQFSVLASFNPNSGVEPIPRGPVAITANGNIYGTTLQGGANNRGSVFELAAGSSTINTLISFNSSESSAPHGGLIDDSSGNLYGTTSGGAFLGSVFEVPSGTNTLNTLATFNTRTGEGPASYLIEDASGNLYGTTEIGGANNDGTVFEVAAGSSTVTTLASFSASTRKEPACDLLMDSSGNLYGTTWLGGTSNGGTVFKIAAKTHALTTLASFNSVYDQPVAGLVEDAAGNLYGTTSGSGASEVGTVFELAAGTNTLSTLVSFNSTNGAYPYTDLTVGPNGDFFGTTSSGGEFDDGTIFELNPTTDQLTTLVQFDYTNSGSALDGTLVFDAAGDIFGTASSGGANGAGTIFYARPGTGKSRTLHDRRHGFDLGCARPTCSSLERLRSSRDLLI